MVLVPFTAAGAKRFLTKRRSAAAIGHWAVLVVPTANMGYVSTTLGLHQECILALMKTKRGGNMSAVA